MSKYDEATQMLNDMAKIKMAMNSHKGDIADNSSRMLVGLLKKEVEELEEAGNDPDGNLMHVIEEAADVQNFLLALVHRQIQVYRSRKNEIK